MHHQQCQGVLRHGQGSQQRLLPACPPITAMVAEAGCVAWPVGRGPAAALLVAATTLLLLVAIQAALLLLVQLAEDGEATLEVVGSR